MEMSRREVYIYIGFFHDFKFITELIQFITEIDGISKAMSNHKGETF